MYDNIKCSADAMKNAIYDTGCQKSDKWPEHSTQLAISQSRDYLNFVPKFSLWNLSWPDRTSSCQGVKPTHSILGRWYYMGMGFTTFRRLYNRTYGHLMHYCNRMKSKLFPNCLLFNQLSNNGIDLTFLIDTRSARKSKHPKKLNPNSLGSLWP